MKNMGGKVLIAGKGSYIGQSIKAWLEEYGAEVYELDLKNEDWVKFDFSEYNSVIHVAAIVHQKDVEDWNLYKLVNADLPVKVASFAKEQGVKQFIFLSTMAVYGKDKELPYGNIITTDTEPNPTSLYGKSKYLAEKGLMNLESKEFTIAIVRPPNVYGVNCKGNYITNFKKLTRILRIFPKIYLDSRQSMLYIDNLSELMRLIIKKKAGGYYMPQDDETVNTCELMNYIAQAQENKIYFSKLLGVAILLFSKLPIVKKIYGGVSYYIELSKLDSGEYCVITLKEGIKRTIGEN